MVPVVLPLCSVILGALVATGFTTIRKSIYRSVYP